MARRSQGTAGVILVQAAPAVPTTGAAPAADYDIDDMELADLAGGRESPVAGAWDISV